MKKSTVSLAIKILSLVALIAFFIPYCTVSCSGQNFNLSALDIAIGPDVGMVERMDSNPIVFLLLIIPVISLVVAFKLPDAKKNAIANAVCGAVTFIFILVMNSKIKGSAAELGCKFKTNFGFILYLIYAVILIAAGALSYLGKIPDDSNVPKRPDRTI